MNTKEKINKDIKHSLKESNKVKLNLLRVIKGEISRGEDGKTELTEQQVISLLQKFKKNLEIVNDDNAKKEISIINEYLPIMMKEDEIERAIQTIIVTNNYSTMKDIGKIMGDFNKEYGGQADNKLVAEITKNILK
tara:strand:- start:1471 stop:1878 length:408 start_codon:yes stop_codon:yes gene_type:complete